MSDIATIERHPLRKITLATIDNERLVVALDYADQHHVAASLTMDEAEDIARKLLGMVETARHLCDCTGID